MIRRLRNCKLKISNEKRNAHFVALLFSAVENHIRLSRIRNGDYRQGHAKQQHRAQCVYLIDLCIDSSIAVHATLSLLQTMQMQFLKNANAVQRHIQLSQFLIRNIRKNHTKSMHIKLPCVIWIASSDFPSNEMDGFRSTFLFVCRLHTYWWQRELDVLENWENSRINDQVRFISVSSGCRCMCQ